MRPLQPTAQQFIDSILALRPCVAALDCDGTLWDADSGMEFFYWLIAQGLIDRKTAAWALPRYDQYRAGRVDEKTMCGEMVQVCRGLRVAALREAARVFFRDHIEARIFPEMFALTAALRDHGCGLWAVSSSNQWLIEAACEPFGIPAGHVLAAAVKETGGLATDKLLRVPTGPDKATVLRQHTRATIDLAFGNSVHDVALLALAARAFAISPNPDLEPIARERGWHVFHPSDVHKPVRP